MNNITEISSNINTLIESINTEDILTYNASIENEIKNYGGAVLYKNDNIIIASNISEDFYKELLKNPNIDYIESLPLRKYGGNENVDNISINYDTSYLSGTTIINSENTIIKPNIIDGTSGSTDNKSLINLTPSGSTKNNQRGIPPVITNTNDTISINTHSGFTYDILATGTIPIKFEIIKPDNFDGKLDISNVSKLVGVSNKIGTYNITLKAINAFGSYTKDIKIITSESVKILNTKLILNNRIGSNFSYSIDTSGALPKTYSMTINPSGVTSGLILENNIISGITLNSGNFDVIIGVSGLTSSDSKILKLNVGAPPIITSSGTLSGTTNNYIEYNMTSLNSDNIIYNVIGTLNDGLSFKDNIISGVPNIVGTKNITIKATNSFGESTKNLTITIYEIKT